MTAPAGKPPTGRSQPAITFWPGGNPPTATHPPIPVKPRATPKPDGTIVLIIDEGIYQGIAASVAQFQADLANDRYRVIIKTSTMQTPEEVRHYLKETYDTTVPRLKGAILIGDIPKPRYLLFIPALAGCSPLNRGPEEYISMQFYEDLDGTYSQGSPGNCDHAGCYDSHTGSVGSEIWVSVLPFMTSDGVTIDKVNQYFAKNHAYRAGIGRPRKGIFQAVIGSSIDTVQKYNDQVAQLTTSAYAWTPLTSRGNIGLFIDNSLGHPAQYPDAAYGYGTALLTGDYDFAEIGAHGSATTFGTSNGSIWISTSWVNTHSVAATFVWDGSCNNGDLDVDDNLLTALVYSDSKVLVAAGATGEAGGLGSNVNGFYRSNIAQSLAAVKTFGEAYLDHIDAPFQGCELYEKEYYTAPAIFIGDLTLKLQEYMG
jgi:hypothetical protein